MTGIPRVTLSDHVVQQIMEDVRRSGLGVGDEIPSEGDLAERYGVNRLSVREGIRILVARGVLISSQGKRARVASPTPEVLRQILEIRLSQNSLQLKDLVETRQLIEGDLARRAALRVLADGASVAPLQKAVVRMREAVSNREAFIRADLDFHEAVGSLAQADLLSFLLSALNDVLVDARRASFEGRTKRGSRQEDVILAHQRVLDAIAAGQPQAAAGAMREHLGETARDLGL